MRALIVSLFLVSNALILGAQSQASQVADETAVRSLVARYVAAREQRDEKAVAALFTADADQLVSSGEWRKGRENLVKGAMASSQASTGKRTIAVESVRFITPHVAIADGRYEIAGSGGTPDRRMWASLIATRTRDGWRIAAIRNMLPAPPAR